MRRTVTWLVIIAIAALIETTWLDVLRIGGVLPDLTALLVVYFALNDGEERAMYTGLVGGLFQDVAGDSILGHHVLSLVLIGFAIGVLNTRLTTEHPIIKTGLVFIGCLVSGLLYTIIQYIQEPNMHVLYTVIERVVPMTFYTALLTAPAFWFLDRIMNRFSVKQGVL